MVYGNLGQSAEALADMYEITHDREILDELVKRADMMLAGRNDPEKGRILWTGNRELIWPNSPDSDDEFLYAGTENGDVIGHIVNVARLDLLKTNRFAEEFPAKSPRIAAAAPISTAQKPTYRVRQNHRQLFASQFRRSANQSLSLPPPIRFTPASARSPPNRWASPSPGTSR